VSPDSVVATIVVHSPSRASIPLATAVLQDAFGVAQAIAGVADLAEHGAGPVRARVPRRCGVRLAHRRTL
jgi:hypothetical protein